MENKEILIQMRELIGDPTRWTTGAYAVDNRGYTCIPTSPYARQWCVLGAAEKVTKGEQAAYLGAPIAHFLNDCARELREARYKNHEKRGLYRSAWCVNDWGGHEAILELLDYAIGRAGE